MTLFKTAVQSKKKFEFLFMPKVKYHTSTFGFS